MGKKNEYTNGELTIVWQPELCQHAGICVKMLPNVYHPKERPWVQIENATTEELIAFCSFFSLRIKWFGTLLPPILENLG